MVGDPTGRATARTPIARETMELNEAMLASGIQRFFDKATQYAEHRVPRTSEATQPVEVINNKTWTKNLTLLDFLRDVGARARVNSMLSRDRYTCYAIPHFVKY